MQEGSVSEIDTLNRLLERLNEVFPYHDVQILRDKLIHCNAETKLHVATESLLQIKHDPSPRCGRMEDWERFRNEDYQTAVKKFLRKEFKGLSSSTIRAVLAENNSDYCRCRRTLLEISSKSWRFAVSTWWYRRKLVNNTTEISPEPTGCAELDQEINSLGAAKREEVATLDGVLARKLNEQEYEAAGALVECQCCFGDYTWEDVVACSEGHIFCRTCLMNVVREGLYGQGNNLRLDCCSVSCLSSTAEPSCIAAVPEQVLNLALPQDMLQALRIRVTDENLTNSGLNLVKCAFCTYAEVEEVFPYKTKRTFLSLMVWMSWISVSMTPLVIILPFLVCFLLLYKTPFKLDMPKSLQRRLDRAVCNLQRKSRGQMFQCENKESCGKKSCLDCGKEWLPFHKCFEEEEDGMRIYVERAMAEAVKRTCPMCSVSFIKSDGCNKLTCICGYIMCYLCRADIKSTGYQHFCQHFRQLPGTACAECDRCDLYVQEDETSKIQVAAKKAEEEYLRRHVTSLGWSPVQGRTIGNIHMDVSDRNSADHHILQWPTSFDTFLEGILQKIIEWDLS